MTSNNKFIKITPNKQQCEILIIDDIFKERKTEERNNKRLKQRFKRRELKVN